MSAQLYICLCNMNKVYHGTRGQIASVVDTPVDIEVSVLQDNV